MKKADNLTTRWNSPTPPFFKKIQRVGIIIIGVSTAILAAPVSLPAVLTTIAGYLLTAGSVLASLSQVTKEDDPLYTGED